MTEDQFFEFCQENEYGNYEMDPDGQVIAQEPTSTYGSAHNLGITAQLYIWNERSNLGITFDSNAGFTLPNKGNSLT